MLQISFDNYSSEENYLVPSILVKAKKQRRLIVDAYLPEFEYCMPKNSKDLQPHQLVYSILNDALPEISELIARKFTKAGI